MADREKVMRGIEYCQTHEFCSGDCPYFNGGRLCVSVIMQDTLALLKEQEARVMTFEEVYKFSSKALDQYGEDSPLYVECRERYPYQLKWLTVERAHEWMRDDKTMERRKMTYNNAKERWGWRCWTSRPTDEQRKAAVWDD